MVLYACNKKSPLSGLLGASRGKSANIYTHIREHKELQQPAAAPWEKSEAARRTEAAAVKMRLYEYINKQSGKAVKEDERELARIIRCDAHELIEAIKSLESEETINVSRTLIGEVDTGYMVYYLASKKI